MDVYKEQLVKRAKTQTDDIKKYALIMGAISFSALILLLSLPTVFAMIGIFAVVGIIFGVVYLIKGMGVEYEYIFTNGEMDIDKISGQRTRKRLATFKIKEAAAFGQFDENTDLDGDYTIINATDGLSENNWYVLFKHRDHGMTYLLFTPEEEMLELVKGSLPAALRR